jgi:hypothetical protein
MNQPYSAPETINVTYAVKGTNAPIQFTVPPNQWLSTTNNGSTLVINRPGLYTMTTDRSRVPPIFRDQVRLTITDNAKNRFVAKGVHNKYVTSLLVTPSEIGTPTSKFSAHMNAPMMPAFNGTLTVVPGPLPY